jgi:Mg2+ and Co2+ transporter CorA
MNLILRPLADYNDVTWSIVISLLILLAGVAYYIYTIMSLAFEELDDERSDK